MLAMTFWFSTLGRLCADLPSLSFGSPLRIEEFLPGELYCCGLHDVVLFRVLTAGDNSWGLRGREVRGCVGLHIASGGGGWSSEGKSGCALSAELCRDQM